MPSVIYLRKSRADLEAEARGEGETLARHEKVLLDLAKGLRRNVTQIYREVVSGDTIAARPMMQRLLSEVSQGVWESVFVMEVERLARGDTIDQGFVAQAFKFSNTKIITPTKTYDPLDEYDEEYFEFGLFMARMEYNTIRRRLQRGREASIKEGKFISRFAPYGYRRVKIEGDKGHTLEPIPEEAEVVKLIFEWYTEGEELPDGSRHRLGAGLLARRLNELHIPPRGGGYWVPATMQAMLRNPVYCGKIRWNYRHTVKKITDGKVVTTRPRAAPEDYLVVPGLHPAIISVETYEKANLLISKNPPRPLGEKNAVRNPLSGLVICGNCGRRMVRRPSRNPNGRSMLMCPLPECSTVASYLDVVEAAILDGLREWLTGYKLEWKDEDKDTPASLFATQEKKVQCLTAELDKLNKQFDNIHDFLEQGIYTTDRFIERSRILADKISITQKDLERAKQDLEEAEAREESRQKFIPQVEYLLDVYNALPTAQAKNDLLKGILEKVVYVKEERAKQGGPLDNFTLTLFPKIPPPTYWDQFSEDSQQ